MGLKNDKKEKVQDDAEENEQEDDDAQYYREEVGEEPAPGKLTIYIVNVCKRWEMGVLLCLREKCMFL